MLRAWRLMVALALVVLGFGAANAAAAVPTVTGFTGAPGAPAGGPSAGGSSINIIGTNFTGVSAVKFGATVVPVANYTLTGASKITVNPVPAGTGTVDVTVVTSGGTSATSSASKFVYCACAVPDITDVAPGNGPTTGGNTVTITGTSFDSVVATAPAAVNFGGTDATSFTLVNATTLTAVVPAGALGSVRTMVCNPVGCSPNTTADDYYYYAPMTVTALSPSSGPATGGTQVTITGTNFLTPTVTFGGVTATGVIVDSTTQIRVTAPAGAGIAEVRVSNPGGTSPDAGAADNYSYVPTISSISPNSGPLTAGASVVITGAGFTAATAVRFGATNAVSYTVNSATQITAAAPAGSAGTVDVSVTTAGGTSANTANDNYTYVVAPTISALSPTSGPDAGGTTVTITGTGLTGTTSVTFGGVAAPGYTVVSATTITATAPAHAAGTFDVRVVTAGGTSANTSADDFTFTLPCSTGSLTVAPTDTHFGSVALNGQNRTASTSTTINVTDMSGTGLGWRLDVGGTQFTAGAGRNLAANAARITGASATTLGGSCTAPASSISAYPITVPTSPAKTTVYNAATNTGKGSFDVRLDVDLDVPANALAGVYQSTWSVDLAAGP